MGFGPWNFRIALIVIVLAGVAFRWTLASNSAVEHFDEGVYSCNLLLPDGYPQRHYYAPPLLPASIEWSQVFFGIAPHSALIPAMLFGAALIGLAGCVGRWWSNDFGGIAAAALTAACEPLAYYSATALTDVPLACWMLLAVGAFWQAVRSEGYGWLAIASVAAAAAWWTKYNGWLAITIPLGAWVLLVRTRLPKGTALKLAGFALLSVALWLPVLNGLQAKGGYAGVSQNHARYFQGASSWFANLQLQLKLLQELDTGGFSALVCVAAFLFMQRRLMAGVAAAVVTIVAAWTAGGVAASLALAAAALVSLLLDVWRTLDDATASDRAKEVNKAKESKAKESKAKESKAKGRNEREPALRRLAVILLFVWWGGMLLSVPLYHPYPRITMPWLTATCLVIGVALGRRRSSTSDSQDASANSPAPFALVVVAMTGGVLWQSNMRPSQVAAPRTGVQQAAALIVKHLSDSELQDRAIVYVLGEPAMVHHLRLNGVTVAPVGEAPDAGWKGNSRQPEFFLIGPHSRPGTSVPLELTLNAPYQPSWLIRSNLDWEPSGFRLFKEP